jgi:hypothetical protein
MSSIDMVNYFTSTQVVDPAAATSTVTSSSHDCRDCGPDVYVIASLGAATGTSPTCDVKLQESRNENSADPEAADAWSDITGATLTQMTGTSDNTLFTGQFHNRKERYVRAVATIAGTSPSFLLGIILMSRKTSW